MAPVVIHKGPVDANDFLENVAREDWQRLLNARCTFVQTQMPFDCRQLLRFVEEGRRMFEALGYASLEDLIRRGLEIDPELVDWAVCGLATMCPDEPIPLDVEVTAPVDQAIALVRKMSDDERAEVAIALAEIVAERAP